MKDKVLAAFLQKFTIGFITISLNFSVLLGYGREGNQSRSSFRFISSASQYVSESIMEQGEGGYRAPRERLNQLKT